MRAYAPPIRSLDYAENDVNDLARALELGGYPKENICILTGERGARDNYNHSPNSKNIRRELEHLARQCDRGDHVLLAFAGHGVQYHGEETMYFCPADADLKNRQTLIAVEDVYKTLEGCKADLKVLLMDACRNDPLNQLDRGPLDEFESVTRPPKAPPPGGVVALFSCSATQEAMEDRELRHGVFFHYVIEALTGAAGLGDAPDEVTLPQLEYYVKKRVKARVWSRYKKNQEPELKTRGVVGLAPLVKLDIARREVKSLRDALAKRLKGDYDGANREMSRVVSLQPDSAEVHLQQGRLLYDNDKYAEAIVAYNKALELEPRNVLALTDRGEARFLNGDAEGALADYNAAVDVDPKYELVYLRAGVVRHNQKDYDRALANYTKAIDLDPRDARAWYFRGLVKEEQEDYSGALKDYDKARQINPRKNEYRTRLALMQQQLSNPSAAIDNLNKAALVDPSDENAFFYRGYVYAQQGNYDMAIQDYSRVLRINPGADYAHYYRGSAYNNRGDSARANADWGRVQRGSQFYDSARHAQGGGGFRDFNQRGGRGGGYGPGGGGYGPGGGFGRGGGYGPGGGFGPGGGGGGGGGRRGR